MTGPVGRGTHPLTGTRWVPGLFPSTTRTVLQKNGGPRSLSGSFLYVRDVFTKYAGRNTPALTDNKPPTSFPVAEEHQRPLRQRHPVVGGPVVRAPVRSKTTPKVSGTDVGPGDEPAPVTSGRVIVGNARHELRYSLFPGDGRVDIRSYRGPGVVGRGWFPSSLYVIQ